MGKRLEKLSKVDVEIEAIEAPEGEEGPSRQAIVRIPLRGKDGEGKSATILLADLARYVEKHGFLFDWRYRSNGHGQYYVSLKSKQRALSGSTSPEYVQVAWLIMDVWPEHGEEIEYADAAHLDLRSDRLKIKPKGTAYEKLEKP